MRATCGFVGLLVVLTIGYYIYSTQIDRGQTGARSVEQVNIVRIKSDLLALAQAERYYLATNGRYGTLEELRGSGNVGPLPKISPGGRAYELEVDGARHFRIFARPPDAVRTDLHTFSIDETMQITP